MEFVMAKYLFVSSSKIALEQQIRPNLLFWVPNFPFWVMFDNDTKRHLAITNFISSTIEPYDVDYMFLLTFALWRHVTSLFRPLFILSHGLSKIWDLIFKSYVQLYNLDNKRKIVIESL